MIYRIFEKYYKNMLALLILLCTSHSYAQEERFDSKIAVVNIETILEKAIVISNIKKDLHEISEKIESNLKKEEIELKRQELDLIQKRGVITEEDYQKQNLEFNQKVTQVQKMAYSNKSSLEKTHAKAMKKVHNATLEIIRKLSDKYNFDIVLPYSHIMFVKNDLDITEEVIEILNKSITKIEVSE